MSGEYFAGHGSNRETDKEKEELACILVQHGQDIQLTIDTDLQVSLHEQFKEDKSW